LQYKVLGNTTASVVMTLLTFASTNELSAQWSHQKATPTLKTWYDFLFFGSLLTMPLLHSGSKQGIQPTQVAF